MFKLELVLGLGWRLGLRVRDKLYVGGVDVRLDGGDSGSE